MDTDAFEKHDRAYNEFKKTHPETTFAQYYAELVAEKVSQGESHATLGRNLAKHKDWWQAGSKAFAKYLRLFSIAESNKVVDYGCGSLRIGGHLIRYLNPDSYYGLDVTSSFYEIGKELIGEELIREKRPQFAAISDSSVATAAAFNPDFVYSSAVAYHVHPDEASTYFGNLARLAHKPGAVLFFDATTSDTFFRYRHRSWSWPLDFYVKSLAPLEFIRMHKSTEREENEKKFDVGILEFRRPKAEPAR